MERNKEVRLVFGGKQFKSTTTGQTTCGGENDYINRSSHRHRFDELCEFKFILVYSLKKTNKFRSIFIF